ncbi:hypothetical protein IMCC9480_992 [Oxalobacteraceae bacterium IMCC9480]|nr:hypothetical protein IMCC9480_992 [Oxalobacteraceae bacterium IMCC9480]
MVSEVMVGVPEKMEKHIGIVQRAIDTGRRAEQQFEKNTLRYLLYTSEYYPAW